MAKKTQNSDANLLILLAAAVVIFSVVIFGWFVKDSGKKMSGQAGRNKPESTADLMNELQGTVDDGGEEDLLRLRNEANSL